MSYCRWSCLGGYCDVYVYKSEHGWTNHVALQRPPTEYNEPDLELLLAGQGDATHPASLLYQEKMNMAEKNRENNVSVNIDHPAAGETFCYETAKECAVHLQELHNEGLIIPHDVIQTLLVEDEEEEEMSESKWYDDLLRCIMFSLVFLVLIYAWYLIL